MDNKLLKILKRVLRNNEYDFQRHIYVYSNGDLSKKDKDYLDNSNFEINQPVFLTHDEIVNKLIDLSKNQDFTMERMTKTFVASMSSYPRGVSPIISYLYASKLEKHNINSRDYEDKLCLHCGVVPEKWYDKVIIIYNLYSGRLWNNCIGYLVDLEEFTTLEPVEPTKEDWNIFNRLIKVIEESEEKESVSKLEKRIKAEKVFPKNNSGKIRDTLFVLSMLGVMPSKTLGSIYDKFITQEELFASPQVGSHRSDIEPPLNGWKGKLGIDQTRLGEIFDTDIIFNKGD